MNWNYWPNWDWKRELTNPTWADHIKIPVKGQDDVPLRIKEGRDFRLVQTDAEYQNLLRNIKEARFIGFDTEANGLDQFAGDFEAAGLCFAFDVDQGWYLPLNHHTRDFKFGKLFGDKYKPPFRNFDQAKVFRDLAEVGFNEKPIVCHYANYELHLNAFLSRTTKFLNYVGHRGPIFDALYYFRVDDPLQDNGLKERCSSSFGYSPIEFREALGKDAVFNDTDPRTSKEYAGADPVNTLRLAYYAMNQGFKQNVYDVCNIVEWPLIKDIADIEAFGIRLDVDKLASYAKTVEPHIERLEREVRRLTRRDFNPRSAEEKLNLLFRELRCPTPDGKPADTTSSDALKEVEVFIPSVIEDLNKYRAELETYLDGRAGLSGMFPKAYKLLNKANSIFIELDPDSLKTLTKEEAKVVIKKHVQEIFQWVESSKSRLTAARKVIKALRQHTALFKLFSAFLNAMPKKLSPQDGLLHTRFNQIVRSGRQSGTDPNLMQLPREAKYTVEYEDMDPEEFGLLKADLQVNDKGHIIIPADVRECLLPPPGMVFVCADWDGMELRMLAAISGCPVLTDVVNGFDEDGVPYDPHLKSVELLKLMPQPYMELKKALASAEAKKKTGEALTQIEKDVKKWRQMVKPINFGLVYGITEFGLAAQLDITPEEARKLMKKYFDTYYGVRDWLERTHKGAKERGYSRTILGRERTIPPAAYADEHELSHYIRACGNHEDQGNCADIAKYCERQVCDALFEGIHVIKRTRQFCNFIHDEFIIACKDDPETVQYCATLLQLVMQKKVSGIVFTATPEVKHNLSKDAKNYMSDYPSFKDPVVIQKITQKLGFQDPSELSLVPWWGPEVDALIKVAA